MQPRDSFGSRLFDGKIATSGQGPDQVPRRAVPQMSRTIQSDGDSIRIAAKTPSTQHRFSEFDILDGPSTDSDPVIRFAKMKNDRQFMHKNVREFIKMNQPDIIKY